MAHYAQIDNNNIVVQVIKTNDNQQNTEQWLVETYGGKWIETSYNTKGNVHYAPNTNIPDGGVALRYNYAGVGYVYDQKADAFYDPNPPYPSWKLNKKTYTWVAPVKQPKNSVISGWNETTQSWETVSSPYPSWIIVNGSWTSPTPQPALIGWTWDEDDKMWYRTGPLVPDVKGK